LAMIAVLCAAFNAACVESPARRTSALGVGGLTMAA
jgi:hypothetical protein